MRSLSILIAANGEVGKLESGLVSVLANRPAAAEVVVALGCEYADPYELEGEVRFVRAPHGASLVECLNAGLRACRGDIVHVLSRGAEVRDGWTDTALVHFDDPRVASVAPLIVRLDDPKRVLCAGLDHTTSGRRLLMDDGEPTTTCDNDACQVLGASLLAGFFRRAAFEGEGFDVRMGDQLTDADLALRWAAKGRLAILEPSSRVAADRAALATESAFAAGRHAERHFWRHLPRAKRAGGLLLHACDVLGELGLSLVRPTTIQRLAGRAAAYFDRQAATPPRPAAKLPRGYVEHEAHATSHVARPASRDAVRLT